MTALVCQQICAGHHGHDHIRMEERISYFRTCGDPKGIRTGSSTSIIQSKRPSNARNTYITPQCPLIWWPPSGDCSDVSGDELRSNSGGDNIRDQIVPVLLLLETAERHLGAGDVLLGVLEIVELGRAGQRSVGSGYSPSLRRGLLLTRVFSSQTMPFCLFASV